MGFYLRSFRILDSPWWSFGSGDGGGGAGDSVFILLSSMARRAARSLRLSLDIGLRLSDLVKCGSGVGVM